MLSVTVDDGQQHIIKGGKSFGVNSVKENMRNRIGEIAAAASDNALFVGVDTALRTFTAVAVNNDGMRIGTALTVVNNPDGVTKFLTWISGMVQTENCVATHIGVEACAQARHLLTKLASDDAYALMNSECTLYQVNAQAVCMYKKSTTVDGKSDEVDAYTVADFVRVRFTTLFPYHPRELEGLREMTRARQKLIKSLAREKLAFGNMMMLKFSEGRRLLGTGKLVGFSTLTTDTARTLCTKFESVEALANAKKRDILDVLAADNKVLGGKVSLTDIEQLKRAARESYQPSKLMNSALTFSIACSTTRTALLKNQIMAIDKAVDRMANAIPPGIMTSLMSIPGMTRGTAAQLYAEIDCIDNFRSERALARYAGLTWPPYQSGTSLDAQRHLVTRCNHYLRHSLCHVARQLAKNSLEFGDYFERKRAEVTNKGASVRALLLTARRVVRLIYALLTRGEVYHAGRMQMAVDRAAADNASIDECIQAECARTKTVRDMYRVTPRTRTRQSLKSGV